MQWAMEEPFKRVKAQIVSFRVSFRGISFRASPQQAAGSSIPSFTSTSLQEGTHREKDIIWSAGTLYAAGADTVCWV